MKRVIPILSLSVFLLGCGKDDGTVSFDEQLAKDIEIIDAHLKANNIDAEVHASGIRYVVIHEGDGARPTVADQVVVTYRGTLLDGTEFDKNLDGITFPLGNLIQAWQIMIPEMQVGGKMIIYAPSGYCYGNRAVGDVITPNANLIFEIELLDVNP